MKFSFIIPVYNGEIYIERCFASILNQTYKNYEVIVINDGSDDDSLLILKDYAKKYQQIQLYSTNNQGLSASRNYGISKIKGDYLIFVDIDDYVNLKMLEYLNEKLLANKNSNLIKYSYFKIKDIDNPLNINSIEEIEVLNGHIAFRKLVYQRESFESACIYAFNVRFWLQNDFKFATNKYHEDFGLIPYIILKAEKVILTNKVLYYYVQSRNSIMRSNNYRRKIKRFNDILYHFDFLFDKVNEIKLDDNDLKLFYSYIANAVLMSYNNLKRAEKTFYKKELKKRDIISLLLNNTFIRKIKKVFYKMFI